MARPYGFNLLSVWARKAESASNTMKGPSRLGHRLLDKDFAMDNLRVVFVEAHDRVAVVENTEAICSKKLLKIE